MGSSRTDAGVHALAQTTHFTAPLSLDAQKMCYAWNSRLPSGIYVRSVEQVPGYFNPCINVDNKVYYYHIFLKRPLPFVSRYGWNCSFINHVDTSKFIKALSYYPGTHDFRSFCKVDAGDTRTTIRTIESISVERLHRYNMMRVIIVGKSFLHFQIRRMIGYALDISRRKSIPADFIKSILDTPDPQQALVKADASGLCLRKIKYVE